MKKLFLLSLILFSVLLVACSREKESYDYEAAMKELAIQVYEERIKPSSIENITVQEIELGHVRNINNKYGGNFELDKLKNCSDESRVDLTIDKNTKEVIEYEFTMYCK